MQAQPFARSETVRSVASKEIHDSVFNSQIPAGVRDVIWAFNCFKSISRGLSNYLGTTRIHKDSDQSDAVFTKPVVRAATHYLCMLWLAQRQFETSDQYSQRLNKKASPVLIDEVEIALRSIVARVKAWYLDESNDLAKEVTVNKIDRCVVDLAPQLKLNVGGPNGLYIDKAIGMESERSATRSNEPRCATLVLSFALSSGGGAILDGSSFLRC